jgi:hypothetical protein
VASWARRPRSASALLGLAAVLATASPATAQFGQNKVQYRHFEWKVLETAHFKIHYYEQEREAALQAARMAERSYEYLGEFYQHEMTEKVPLILYSSHQDFEQSNVIGGFISEGTGGVTESLKGRVTLPLTGSYGELNHVLTHELVHAFQFDLLQRSVRGMLGIGPLPLWMMEGMAEWVSNGMDPVTSMWIVDAVKRKKLPSVPDMANLQDIRVYRMGQALYEVIAAHYGPDRIRRILKRPEMRDGLRDSTFAPLDPPSAMQMAAAPDSVVFAHGTSSGTSLDKHWKAYADSLTRVLGAELVDPDSIAERVSPPGKYGRSYHLAPVQSPAGDRILYYSSRGLRNELFVAERQGDGWKRRSLIAGEETPELETLPLLSASADWAPDGNRVVFVGTQEGRDALQIFDVEKRRVSQRLRTNLLSIGNPSWSPDGRFIVFSGVEGGQEDLFLIEVATQRLTRLTQDAYSERTPHFSPAGDAIVFATDRGLRTDLAALRFGPWNIARMQLRAAADGWAADRIDIMIESDANDFAPVWSPDGNQVAFVSDRDGTHQVYTLDVVTGEVRRRTRFDSGVAGIVPTAPSFSWAASGHVVYSVFRNGGWHLYRTYGFPEDAPGDVVPEKMLLTRSLPAAIDAPAATDAVDKEENYRTRLTPEYAVIGALYVGNAGAAGSGQLLLGDMLGNHYLLLGGFLRSELEESEFLLQYANLGHRWQWGVAGYQYRDDIGLYTAPDSAQFRSLIRLGAGAQVAYPFNRFRRAEFGLDFQTVTDRVADVLFTNTSLEEVDVSRSRFYYVVPSAFLVHDNAAYSGFTPVSGSRWRFGVEQAIGNIDYTFGLVDYRKYFNIRTRGAVAVRWLGAGSNGPESQRLRLGGPDTFRGAEYGDISGSRVTFSNIEFRFPIIPATELLRGVAFVDVATAWRHGLDLRDLRPMAGGRFNDVHVAPGFGIRGFVGVPLRIDTAIDLHRGGEWITQFSIGFDY